MIRPFSRPALPLAVVEAAALLALLGCNGAPGRPKPGPEVIRPEEVQDFETLYRHNCAGCHGAEGQKGPAVSLSDSTYLAFVDDATLRKVTANGVPGTLMPPFERAAGGTLTTAQIEALVHGIRGRWGKNGVLGGADPPPYAAASPGDAGRGADVYGTYCASCHGPGGHGSTKAHSVVDGSYLALVSEQGLRTMVIVGVPDRGAPDWRNDVPGRPMSDQEISDVVAWLESQRPKSPGQPYPSVPAPGAGGVQ